MFAADWEAAIQWWDGVELWLTQQWLPVQLVLLVAVLLPACWGTAVLIDRGVDRVSEWLSRRARSRDGEGSP